MKHIFLRPQDDKKFWEVLKASFDEDPRKASRRKKIYIALAVLILILTVWDIADPPLWWQFDRQADKKAILNYVNIHYKDEAKFIRSDFPLLNPGLVGVPIDSVMYYEYNGIEFGIFAKKGVVLYDGYYLAKANREIDTIIFDNFIAERNINAEYRCDFYSTPPEELSKYSGTAVITINCTSDSLSAKPIDIEWFYDFYVYWTDNSPLKHYDMCINFYVSDNAYYKLRFNEKSEFENKNAFYNDFKFISYDD